MPKFSVIVPVYQVEHYLALCLETIRNQSICDLEIICVNDGSTDRSAELLKMSAAVDPRLKIINKPNGGLSSARNAGIKAATGEYLMFVDSDDMLTRNACATVLSAFEESAADIVTFGAHCHPEGSGYPWLVDCLSPRDAVYNEFDTDILFKEKSRPYVWRTAFSRAFLLRTGLLFDETVVFGEDQVFHFLAYPQAQKTVFLADKLYEYRVSRKDSLMADRHAEILKKLQDHLVIVDRIITGWETLGLLKRHASKLLDWILSFLIYDIRAQEPDDRTVLLRELHQILARRLSKEDLASANLSPQANALLKAIVLATTDEDLPKISKMQMYRYYLEQYGLRRCMARLVSGFFHIRPFGILYECLRRILPAPTKSMQQYLWELESNIRSDHQATNALLLLTAEYAAHAAHTDSFPPKR
jgi:glycosyltransferase involved in cell wall biosynthesis